MTIALTLTLQKAKATVIEYNVHCLEYSIILFLITLFMPGYLKY